MGFVLLLLNHANEPGLQTSTFNSEKTKPPFRKIVLLTYNFHLSSTVMLNAVVPTLGGTYEGVTIIAGTGAAICTAIAVA